METPPPYSAPKKKNTGLIIGLVIGGVALCCVGPMLLLGGGAFFMFNQTKGFATCLIGMEQLRDSVLAYAEANDGKLPKAKTWMNDVRPYFKKEVGKVEGNPFAMSTEGTYACPGDGGEATGIAYNSALSGKTLKSIQDKVATVVLFEIEEPAENAARAYKELPVTGSPKIMNETRGWLTVTLEGDVQIPNKKFRNRSSRGGGVVNIETKSE
jgi:hypothetical protein